MTAPAAGEGPKVERVRVGLWFGLLLLFVPVFYPLLYFRPYSLVARIGWGLWLGLIVFAKLSGMSEPVINLSELEEQVRRQEQVGATAERSVQGTFVRPDEEVPLPPLVDYLRELGGGILGRHIADYSVDGDTIRIAFRAMDSYLGDETALSLESIGVALSLFYGRDFHSLEMDYVLRGAPVHVALTRKQFEGFFAMTPEQIRASLFTREGQENSPFRAENLPPEQVRAFFERFASYR